MYLEEENSEEDDVPPTWSNEPYLFSSALQEAMDDEANWLCRGAALPLSPSLSSSFFFESSNIDRGVKGGTSPPGVQGGRAQRSPHIQIVQWYNREKIASFSFPATAENARMVVAWRKFYEHARSQRQIMKQFARIDINFLNDHDRADEASTTIDRFEKSFSEELKGQYCSIFLAQDLVKFSWSMRTYVSDNDEDNNESVGCVFEKMFAPDEANEVKIFAPFDLQTKYIFYCVNQWIASKDVVTIILKFLFF